jgi:hypothetical protein
VEDDGKKLLGEAEGVMAPVKPADIKPPTEEVNVEPPTEEESVSPPAEEENVEPPLFDETAGTVIESERLMLRPRSFALPDTDAVVPRPSPDKVYPANPLASPPPMTVPTPAVNPIPKSTLLIGFVLNSVPISYRDQFWKILCTDKSLIFRPQTHNQ